MRTLRATMLALAIMLSLSACASSGSGSNSEPFSSARPTTVRIIVQNRNFQDARLYTYRRGRKNFLGIVTGKRDAEFVIDWDFSDPMYIEIDMLAGPKCFTEELPVDPGDILELQIAPVFSSTAACR
jgi:hypothetical protein